MDILLLISEKMLSVSIYNIMLAIDLLYIAIIILTYFHVFQQFPELLSQNMLNFVNGFSAFTELIHAFLFVSLFICCIPFADLCKLKHLCLLGMMRTWS